MEVDRYDYDLENGTGNYCAHGTYVGTPYGPDYICGLCEDGVDPEEWRKEQRAWERKRSRLCTHLERLYKSFSKIDLKNGKFTRREVNLIRRYFKAKRRYDRLFA